MRYLRALIQVWWQRWAERRQLRRMRRLGIRPRDGPD